MMFSAILPAVLRPRIRRLRVVGVLACLIAVAAQAGCVQRRLTVRSDPPGAAAYIDDYPVGITPVSTEFVYYGTRKIRLVKPGYETLTVLQPIKAPWYQYPGLDFVSENLVPGEIRDERVVEFKLQPQMIVPNQQLMPRAEELRRAATVSPGIGPPGTPPPPGTLPIQPGYVAPMAPPQVVPGINPTPQPNPGLPASPPPTMRPGSPFNY